MLVKINAISVSIVFLQSDLGRLLSVTSFILMSVAAVTWKSKKFFD